MLFHCAEACKRLACDGDGIKCAVWLFHRRGGAVRSMVHQYNVLVSK